MAVPPVIFVHVDEVYAELKVTDPPVTINSCSLTCPCKVLSPPENPTIPVPFKIVLFLEQKRTFFTPK